MRRSPLYATRLQGPAPSEESSPTTLPLPSSSYSIVTTRPSPCSSAVNQMAGFSGCGVIQDGWWPTVTEEVMDRDLDSESNESVSTLSVYVAVKILFSMILEEVRGSHVPICSLLGSVIFLGPQASEIGMGLW